MNQRPVPSTVKAGRRRGKTSMLSIQPGRRWEQADRASAEIAGEKGNDPLVE